MFKKNQDPDPRINKEAAERRDRLVLAYKKLHARYGDEGLLDARVIELATAIREELADYDARRETGARPTAVPRPSPGAVTNYLLARILQSLQNRNG